MMKVKVAFGNDMRLFKYEGASLSEAYDALTTFVSKTFEVETFRLQYRDDEDDLITVSTEHELDEAFDFAMEQGKTLKLFVVAVAAQRAASPEVFRQEEVASAVVEEKAEVPAEAATAEGVDGTEAGDGNGHTQNMHDLAGLILENEGFRQEFAAFAQDVVLQLREGDDFQTAVQTALVAHEDLAQHEFVRDHFMVMLPCIAEKAAFAVPFLKTMEPTAIPGMIEQAAQSVRNGHHMMPFLAHMMSGGAGAGCGGFPFGGVGAPENGCAPPMMGPFGGLGGMPFFGGGFGPHGQGQGAPTAEQGCSPMGPGWHHGARGGHHGFGGHRGFGHGRRGHGGRGRGRGRFHGQGGACGKRSGGYRADVVDPNVTLADKALVLPNSSVVKTWRIRNTGEEDFPEGTKLKYVGRPFNQLVDGVEFPVEAIPVGEEGEVSILLSTPQAAGRFGSAWRLQLPDGTPFGPMFRARVVVVSGDGVPGEGASDESDDMADVYDQAAPQQDKQEKKLQKMLQKKARLEARLAKLGSKIEGTERVLEEMSGGSATEADSAPIVSTLPSTTSGGDGGFMDNEDADDAVVQNETVDAFANELAELQNMGFGDLELNRMLLRQYDGQMDAVLNTLLELKA